MLTDMYTCAHLSFSGTHRQEQYAPKQGPSERCFNDLFITFGASAVSLQQCRDVECHFCDGAKRRVHHRSHCKVTLCRNAVGIRIVTNKSESRKKTLKITLLRGRKLLKSLCTFSFHSTSGQGQNSKTKKALPGYTHANKVGQRNDGSDGCGKLGLCAEVIVFMVSIANNQCD